MRKCRIDVYDYGTAMQPLPRDQRPKCYTVDANCVGGKEGVLATFQHPDLPDDCFGIAKGDDGSWSLIATFHKGWIKEMLLGLHSTQYDMELGDISKERGELADMLEAVIDAAKEGIEHVGSYNGQGREAEAKSMLIEPADALFNRIRGK